MSDHDENAQNKDDMYEAEPVAPPSSFVDSDMEDTDGAPLMCKNYIKVEASADTTKHDARGASEVTHPDIGNGKIFKSESVTPQELYAQINKSRDKLFFISYIAPDVSKKWYLIRVDLETCYEVDQTKNCKNSGHYYVEFYMKANDDQTMPDPISRWWLIWNAFRYKKGQMIIGSSREFDPNSKAAIKRRLMEISKKTNDDANYIPQFQANLKRFTTYSDILDLSDANTRLVGPFDFKARDRNVDGINLGGVLPDNVYVRDQVPMGKWIELRDALKGRNITLPTMRWPDNRKKKKTPNIKDNHASNKSACHLCGEVDSSQEMLSFEETPNLSALCVHKACGLSSVKLKAASSKKVISSGDVSELIGRAQKSIRRALTSDGEVYFMLDELKAQIDVNLNRFAAQNNMKSTCTPSKLSRAEVYLESEFDPNELQTMPVVFAYHTKNDDPDGTSERNAKIAKLDHDVAKRREKRLARQYADVSEKSFKSRSHISEQCEKTTFETNTYTTQPPTAPVVQTESIVEANQK